MKMLHRILLILLKQCALCIFIVPATAGTIAAWTSGFLQAPQVIMYDYATSTIIYSLCNSNNTPSFKEEGTAAFDLAWPPLNGTSVSGFTSEHQTAYEKTILTTIQYQETSGRIVSCTFSCNTSSGYYKSYASSLIDLNAPQAFYPKTDLVIVRQDLASEQSKTEDPLYWLFYKSMNRSSSVAQYDPLSGAWRYKGYTSQDSASALSIAATISDNGTITYASPRSDEQGVIETATFNSNTDASWNIQGFPRALRGPSNATNEMLTNNSLPNEFQYGAGIPQWSLDAFNGSKSQIRLATGYDDTCSMFYVGTDKYLHELGKINGRWQIRDEQSEEVWPMADEEDAHLALTFSGRDIWMYYVSNASIVELHQSGPNTWEPATTLINLRDRTAFNEGIDPGMSDTTKIDLGVSLGAVIVVVGLLAEVGIYLSVRRRHLEKRGRRKTDAAATSISDSAGEWRDSSEMSSPGQPAYEMAPEPRAYEVPVEERINQLMDDDQIPELSTTRTDEKPAAESVDGKQIR